MLRANKKFVALLILGICLFSIRHAQADETYEVPIVVTGTGLTPAEAEDNAWANAYQAIADLIDSLGPNEVILHYHYPVHGFISPNEYMIEIIVTIQVTTPPEGGGGGSGGPSGGGGGGTN